MKRYMATIFIFSIFMAGCSKNYIVDGYLSPAFDKSGTYTIAVLSPYIQGNSSEALRDRLHNHLILRISKTGHFLPIEKTRVTTIESARGIGSMKADPSDAREIAQELNAQLVCITEIGIKPIGKDKGMPLYCSISIIDVNSGVEIYRGTGRTANPASIEAGGEWVIDLATQELLNKMK